MTPRQLTVALLLAIATMLVVVPARGADGTTAALSVVCPGKEYLAPHVNEAARRYLVSRMTLVAQMFCESRCRPTAIGRAGEVGLMQLHGVAANGMSLFELAQPRENVMAGARWLSLRERDCGGQAAGLAGYPARKCGSKGGRRYARRVLAVVERIRKAIEAKGANRS